MSAPVCWIQASAPAISLYAFTVVAQPTLEINAISVVQTEKLDKWNRGVYMPCMHVLFFLCMLGISSSIQSLMSRWQSFHRKPFSPAHMAFCFPTLAHANAAQSYLSALNAYSPFIKGTVFYRVVHYYWVLILLAGTCVTVCFVVLFFYHLPSWTNIDVADEDEPPPPFDTTLNRTDALTAGDTFQQDFVSPAVLQANETGALVSLPRGADGRHRYVRTRRVTALGFEPILNQFEMEQEKEILLDWVGRHPPCRRKRTLSVPGVDFSYGYGSFGVNNEGVYATQQQQHNRAASHMPFQQRTRVDTDDLPSPWQFRSAKR